MKNNIYNVRFSKIKDEKGDLQVQSVSATVYVGQSGNIQFVSKHPFELDFTGNYPFKTGSNPIVGAKVGNQYQTDLLSLQGVGQVTAYPYNVILDKGTGSEASSDPQVIVDPDQPILLGILAAAGAGAIAGAIAAFIVSKK